MTVRKPKQRRALATVEVIVEAAARILAEQGWSGFTTNAVAKRAGVSIGSLYEYFPNKQALIDRIALDHLARGEALLADAAAGVSDAHEVEKLVDFLVQGVVDLHRDDPRLHRALSADVPLSPSIRERIESLRQGAVAMIAEWIAPWAQSPRISAQLLVDTTDAVVHRWIVEDDGAFTSPERMVAELRTMLLAYLKAT